MSQKSDVIVLGGGTMGTAAGWALARRGHAVTIIEQFDHYHTQGSHGGNTRIFRHAYAEGASYVPWALEATHLWRGVEERTGAELMINCGCVDISKPGQDRASGARESARLFDLPVEEMTGAEANARYKAWNLPDDWEVTLDLGAGMLVVERCFRALGQEFTEAGGVLRTKERAQSWQATDTAVRVVTDKGTYEADSLVIAAGAWNGKILAELGIPLEPRRKPVMWFRTEPGDWFTPENFPTFVYQDGIGEYYGLPNWDRDTVKIGIHSGGDVCDPDSLDREWKPDDIPEEFREFLTTRLNGVFAETTRTSICMYTMTPDEHFVIDRHPEHDNVAIAAGFSGHGFKFTPKVGEHLADLVCGTDDAVPLFAISRFA